MCTSRHIAVAVAVLFVQGCIGTDFLDESAELFEPRIELSPGTSAIEVDESLAYEAVYFDSTDTPRSVSFSWSSSDDAIVTVTSEGTATGVGPGQARITVRAFDVTSSMALLTVVEDADQVALVELSPADTNITVSTTLQYTARAVNARGDRIEGTAVEWSTSVDSIARIDDRGLLTALRPGTVTVTARTEGIESMPARLDVFARSRNGSFQAAPGSSYRVQGTGTLERTDNGLRVRFLDNFTTSNGPDLHVYLSTASRINATSIDLGNLMSSSGAQTYGVPPNVRMNDFDYIVIHCVPFNVTFGFARLQ